jgi:hypothetical protein
LNQSKNIACSLTVKKTFFTAGEKNTRLGGGLNSFFQFYVQMKILK